MAQLVARLHGMEEVWGSNPHSSTGSEIGGPKGPPISFLAESQPSVLAFWVGLAAGLIGLWFLVRVGQRLGEISHVVLQQPPARLAAAHDRPAAVAERAQEAGAVGDAEQAGHAHAEVRAVADDDGQRAA